MNIISILKHVAALGHGRVITNHESVSVSQNFLQHTLFSQF